jgi:hypothetical protein
VFAEQIITISQKRVTCHGRYQYLYLIGKEQKRPSLDPVPSPDPVPVRPRWAALGRHRRPPPGLPRSDPALPPPPSGALPGKAQGARWRRRISSARPGRGGGDLAALGRPGAMMCGGHSVGGARDQRMLLRLARVSGDVVGMVEAASRQNKGAGARSPSRQGHLWRRR